MKHPKPKPHHRSLSIALPFDEAIKLALKVNPPPGGWKALSKRAKPRESKGRKAG